LQFNRKSLCEAIRTTTSDTLAISKPEPFGGFEIRN